MPGGADGDGVQAGGGELREADKVCEKDEAEGPSPLVFFFPPSSLAQIIR